MPTFTFVPLLPRNSLKACSFLMPMMDFPSTSIIRSPAISPAFSEGPPEMTDTTISVSFIMLNWMPMPSNEPSKASIAALLSSAVE